MCHKKTRPLAYVPSHLIVALLLSFAMQCLWHVATPAPKLNPQRLSHPPHMISMQLMSLNDTITAARLLMLWIQTFDNQAGVSLPLKTLNYDRLTEWLDLVLCLDQQMQYPLSIASRFYAEVPDASKQRKIIDYIREQFLLAPDQRWQFMAHAVYIARYKIKDIPLALEYAKMIRDYAHGDHVPFWVKHMEVFILEDIGDVATAKILIGGLLASGVLHDPQEQKFLLQKLEEMEQR